MKPALGVRGSLRAKWRRVAYVRPAPMGIAMSSGRCGQNVQVMPTSLGPYHSLWGFKAGIHGVRSGQFVWVEDKRIPSVGPCREIPWWEWLLMRWAGKV